MTPSCSAVSRFGMPVPPVRDMSSKITTAGTNPTTATSTPMPIRTHTGRVETAIAAAATASDTIRIQPKASSSPSTFTPPKK